MKENKEIVDDCDRLKMNTGDLIEDDEKIFLKTIIPSRKMNKKYSRYEE